MSVMITVALLLWGIVSPVPIRVVPDTRIESAAANRYVDRCEVAYNPTWFQWLGAGQQSVISHEVGHCIGLNHLPVNEPGVMSGVSSGQAFSGYDRVEFWHHYPAPYRITILGVSN